MRDAVRRLDSVEIFRELFLTRSVYVKSRAADLARELRGIAMKRHVADVAGMQPPVGVVETDRRAPALAI
jgi:hypothetical protein